MDSIHSAFSGYINKLYDKATYLDKYGGSVIATSLTLFAFFLIFSYFYIQSKIKPIRSDWIKQKCNPVVIPFAGMINAGPGESKLEFTAKNFSECTTSILAEIIGFFIQPIHFITNSIGEFFKLLGEAIQKVRELYSKIRQAIMRIVETIIHRTANVLIQLQVLVMRTKTILGKTQGVLASGFYTIMGSYLALKSFFGAMMEIIISFLVMLAAAVILAWIFPFTFPFAAAATTFFIAIAIPTGIIAGWLGHILALTTSNIPSVSSCFDKETSIKMFDKTFKKITEIKLGDQLVDGGFVSATFKISKQNQKIHILNDVIVTGCHDVYYKNQWIKVSNHPESKEILDYQGSYVYCLNTTTKKIIINNTIFADWDEVDNEDIIKLNKIFKLKKKSDIHKYLEGGFHCDTYVELVDGNTKQLKDLKINDQLKNKEKIIGIVEIDTNTNTKKYCLNKQIFFGGPNLAIYDKYLGIFNTLDSGESVGLSGKLYHFITNTGKITIQGITFFDYNGCMEQILWK